MGKFLLLGGVAMLMVCCSSSTCHKVPPQKEAVVGINRARLELLQLGQKDTVLVIVQEVKNLGAFQFDIMFDPAYLKLDSSGVALGGFLASSTRSPTQIGPHFGRSPMYSKCTLGAVTSGNALGPNGNGALAALIFEARAIGATTVEFKNALLTDIKGIRIKARTSQNLAPLD